MSEPFGAAGANWNSHYTTPLRVGKDVAEPGGRWSKKSLTLEHDLLELLGEYTGGDPMTRQRWVRLSLKNLRKLLRARGHTIAPMTIRRLLRKLKFSLRANRKRFTGPRHPDRDRQFRYIARQKKRFLREGCPIISVDAKKKELIGNFKNDGRAWCREAEEVNCHDFLSDAEGRGSPYGVY